MRRVNLFLWRFLPIVVLLCGILNLPARAAEPLQLVMVEQAGCHWCARWNADIAPIWPKTDEGRAAPLRRVDLHKTMPTDLTFSGKVVFTPTFVLTRGGSEIARIEGYSGEELFWWMVSTVFAQNKVLDTD